MIHHEFENGMYVRRQHPDQAKGIIFYLHGLGESGLSLETIIQHERLAKWAHWVPDLPGYGKSPWPATPLSLLDMADMVADWLQSVTDEPVVVCGHSMGGVTGLYLAENYPDLVSGFFNVEGNISLDDCGFSQQVIEYPVDDFIETGFLQLCDKIYQGGFRDRTLRTYYASMRMSDPRTLYRNSEELVAISKTEEIASRLSRLRIPQRYVLGDPNGTGPHSQQLLTAAGIDWQAVPGAGHWPFLDQPDVFAGAMADFLAGL